MAQQNIKLKGKKPVSRTTTSNYVLFNQLGKSKAGYSTQRIIGGGLFGGKPMIETQNFVGKGGPIQKLLNQLGKSKVDNMGKLIAGTLNVTKPYKEQQEGKVPQVGDKPEVLSGKKGKVYKGGKYVGADITRTGVSTTRATGADIVNVGSAKEIAEYGSKIGRIGKETRAALEAKAGAATDPKEKAAIKRQITKTKQRKAEKTSGALKGVSNVFGSFMEAFQRN